ncbi:MAG: methyltransferase domain-containing protein [Candidatus Eremiobacteraeota bacterium]|nr:methyltransferase domain-containing protein [Candidatus Eremiobacteraeota bacterium]
MASEKDLIAWKTNAWKDQNMVAGYAQRMIDPSGAIMFKNRIEVGAFARYVCGPSVLDVGVGTGRASLPLARAGYSVTGVDSSVAMLQKTKELAGSTNLVLQEDDLAKLTFADATFDTVMGLNTIAHFPHWQPILKEWQRVTKHGGRMVFDMFSLDHDVAYAQAIGRDEAYGVDHFAAKHESEYYLRLKIEDLVAFCDESKLRIVKIQPYSVLIGSSGYNRFLEHTPLSGKAWDRLLTWIGADERMFDFLTFVEEELFGNLTSKTACRYVVVLDNVADPDANGSFVRRNTAVNAALAAGINSETMRVAGIDVATFRVALTQHLEHPPSRYAFLRMLSANIKWGWPISLDDLVEERYLEECKAVYGRVRTDAAITALLETFHQRAAVGEALTYRGVPVAKSLEYDLMIAVLDGAVGAFKAPLSAALDRAAK